MTHDERTSRIARRPLPAILVALAGVLGSAGVGVSAAAAHRGGGTLAATAGLFCLLHAAAIVALAGWCDSRTGISGTILAIAACLLFGGTVLFSGDLALAELLDWRPLAAAAPIGGGVMIIGWLLVVVGGMTAALRGD